MSIIDWINTNKEWLFSGIGVMVVTSFITIIKHALSKNKTNKKDKIVIEQHNNGTANIQIGIQNNYSNDKQGE